MARTRPTSNEGKLLCPNCGLWLHHTRFRVKQRDLGSKVRFHAICKVCEQTRDVEIRSDDPATAIILSRAADRARISGVPRGFVMEKLNYWSLVAPLRAILADPSAVCQNCGHTFDGRRDTQLEHIEPPRGPDDCARLHARNIRLLCGSCNNTKGKMPFAVWLDEEESKRLSVEAIREERMIKDPIGATYSAGMLF